MCLSCSTSLSTISTLIRFNFNLSIGYMVVSHCFFNLYSLMTDDTKQLFMCLFIIYISYFVKHLFKFLPNLKINSIVLLLLTCEISWCVLKRSPLPGTCCVNIFSQYMAGLSTFLIVYFKNHLNKICEI